MYVASCSFGKDSIAQIILAHLHNEPLDVIVYSEVMFDEDISAEIPEHREFIYGKAIPTFESWGFKVEVVRSKKTFQDCFYHKIKRSKYPERIGKYVGFPLTGKCVVNRECKIPPIKQFYKRKEMKNVVQYIGIAIDEPKRLERLDGEKEISLLAKYRFTENDAKELCQEYGLLSPIYHFSKRGGLFLLPKRKKGRVKKFIRQPPGIMATACRYGKRKKFMQSVFQEYNQRKNLRYWRTVLLGKCTNGYF